MSGSGDEVGEGGEGEAALVEAGVREREELSLDAEVAVEEEVEVEGAGGERAAASPAEGVLDAEEAGEELFGGGEGGGVKLGDGVEVGGLRLADPARLGLVDAGEAPDAEAGRQHPAHAEEQVPRAVAEVRSHPDVSVKHKASRQ